MSRRGYIIATAAALLTIVGVSVAHVAPRLLWNASASTPIGFYLIGPVDHLAVNDIVAVETPEPLAAFLERRGYLARGVPLLKHVAGLPGQRVCRTGRTITVDGAVIGEALERDRRGRDLPVWPGLPTARGRRRLPHERPGPRQPRRSLFRATARRRDHRPGHPPLHRRGRRWPLRLARADAVTARP